MSNNYYNPYNGTQYNDYTASNIEKELYWRRCIHKYKTLIALSLLCFGLILLGVLCFFIPIFLTDKNVSIWTFIFAKKQNTDSLNSLSDIERALKTQIYYDAKTEFLHSFILTGIEYFLFVVCSFVSPLLFLFGVIHFMITFSDVESKIRLKSNPLGRQQFIATENRQRDKAQKMIDGYGKISVYFIYVVPLLIFPIHFGIFCQTNYFSGVCEVNPFYYVLPIISLLGAIVVAIISARYSNLNKNELIESIVVLNTKI